MTFHALEIARYQLMISVCEKHKYRLKAHENRVKEQIIIDKLKDDLKKLLANG